MKLDLSGFDLMTLPEHPFCYGCPVAVKGTQSIRGHVIEVADIYISLFDYVQGDSFERMTVPLKITSQEMSCYIHIWRGDHKFLKFGWNEELFTQYLLKDVKRKVSSTVLRYIETEDPDIRTLLPKNATFGIWCQ